MSNPADVRIFNFVFPEGIVYVKGLGTKDKEFVVSEIFYEKGKTFTDNIQRSLAIIRPEAVLTDTQLIEAFTLANVEESFLEKIVGDTKVELANIPAEEE